MWPAANNAPKYEIGEKVPYYRNNLENEKAESVEDFLKEVNGLHYIPISTKSLQIAKLLDDLRDATNGYNNYYTEPPIIKEILNYLGPNIEIPNDQEEKLLAVILHCRTGREVTYCHGVSPSAEPRYEKILKSLSNSQALLCLTLLKDIVPYCYHTGVKEKNVRDILQLIATNQINSRTKEIYNYMANYDKLNLVYKDSKFKQLTQGIIG